MPASDIPVDEAARLRALNDLGVLDSPPEPLFDKIVSLTRDLSRADIAAIALLDRDRLWFKAIEGHPGGAMPRGEVMYAYVVNQAAPLWVEDARVDPRFSDLPCVTDGTVRFYAGAPLMEAGGKALGALCILSAEPRAFEAFTADRLEQVAALVVDAMEQRRARQDVEFSIARGMIRHAPTSISVLDRDLRFLMVSEKMEAESGVTEVEVVGRSVYDHFPSMKAVEPMMRRALAGETLSGRRTPMTRRDGKVAICDWELAPWRGPDGAIGGVRVMTFELTELVESQQAAQRSEERLKLAIEVAETVVWELDFKSGRVESVGDSGRFFEDRMTSTDFVGDLLRTVHPDDRTRVDAEWRDTINQGRPFKLEYRLKREDGKDFWVLGTAQAFQDRKGVPERIIGAVRDITRRKEEGLALDRALQAAEAANRAKSEFLANMSHEIRTPLNGVIGVAGALERTGLTADQRDMVRLIETSAQTLESLLTDVLDLARIEAGRMEIRAEPFSLTEVVASVSDLFARQAQAKGIGFRLDQRVRLGAGYVGDWVRLRQIFSNLLSNAVKFTHAGNVTFRVDRQAVEGGGHSLRFQVSDTGVGFDDDARDRLFQRFEQADGSITRQYGGTGLGLAISQSIAEAMGGRVEATSIPGVGSTFTFTVVLEPIERPALLQIAPEPIAPEPIAAGPGRALRVLLAEDHPVNRKVVALILESARVDLTSVVDGAQAVEAFSSQGPFDVILMDIQMPVMDGLTAIQAIRDRERQAHGGRTPIYALTANAMPEHVEASIEAGADGHLSKPIAAATLLGVIEEISAGLEPEPIALRA